MSAGECKRAGVSILCKYYGLPELEVAVIGDDYNDMDMLSYFHGYAVRNAKPAVKKAAVHVVYSFSSMVNSFLKG